MNINKNKELKFNLRTKEKIYGLSAKTITEWVTGEALIRLFCLKPVNLNLSRPPSCVFCTPFVLFLVTSFLSVVSRLIKPN